MIAIPPQAKCHLMPVKISLEGKLDSIIGYCKQFGLNVFSGDIYVLSEPDSVMIGLLSYDGQGFQWSIKRFSEGSLDWWPMVSEPHQIEPKDLNLMLWGGDPKKRELPKLWRALR